MIIRAALGFVAAGSLVVAAPAFASNGQASSASRLSLMTAATSTATAPGEQNRKRKKSGIWLPVVGGVVLIGGIALAASGGKSKSVSP